MPLYMQSGISGKSQTISNAQAAYELVQTTYSWEAAGSTLQNSLKQLLPEYC